MLTSVNVVGIVKRKMTSKPSENRALLHLPLNWMPEDGKIWAIRFVDGSILIIPESEIVDFLFAKKPKVGGD